MDKSTIWVEKYRPTEFSDVVGLPASIPDLCNQNIPCLLFDGRAGTGKTTTARIIVNKLDADCLELNASNERGIDVIRKKVHQFASSMSSNQKIKIVFLDEADGLTSEAMNSLRNTMETYSSTCRFILSCNYLNKIIEPIRSRCVSVSFSSPPKKDIITRITKILDMEGIKYNTTLVEELVNKKYPDMRSIINFLQGHRSELLNERISMEESSSEKIFKLIREKKVMAIREMCIKNSLDINQLYLDVFNLVFTSDLPVDKRKGMIKILSKDYRWLSSVADPEILWLGSVIEMCELL